MNELYNPFTPGAGTPPPELAGRKDIIDQATILLQRVQAGRASRSLLLTGLRGVGKTVLLNEINRIAKGLDYQRILTEAHENKSLPALLVPELRNLLYSLDRMEGAKHVIRRGMAVLAGFVGSVKLTYGDIPVGIDIEPEKGTADSGDIEVDIPHLFTVLGEAAASRKTTVVLLIDELQYLKEKELSALIMGMHKIQQERLPIVLIGAGLPILPRLAGESKSYAERLFDFPYVGSLNSEDAVIAIRGPIVNEGENITDEAVEEIVEITGGYPYFLQAWGYQVWNHAAASPITVDAVRAATEATTKRLDENFFKVRFDRLTKSEKDFLRAMAEMGAGPYNMSDVADVMGLKVKSLSPRRSQLIHKGMVYSPQHSEIDFTVPLFDEFMRRAMPELKPKKQN